MLVVLLVCETRLTHRRFAVPLLVSILAIVFYSFKTSYQLSLHGEPARELCTRGIEQSNWKCVPAAPAMRHGRE